MTVRPWWVLAILSGALALVSLDNTIVNVALPSLQEDLKATTSQLQWVVDAYSVLFAGTLLLAGSLGDRFGRRRMLVVGLLIFIAASVLAALAPSAIVLTLARGIMGIGGAFIMPSTLSILVQVFPAPHDRAKAIGIWAAVAGAGVALGPIVGGLLLEHFSWHAIFLVNPPLSLALLVAVLMAVPESSDPSKPRLDPWGAALSSLGLIALVVFIIEVPDSGISIFTLGALVVAIVSLFAFVRWEKRAPRPLLPLTLFGSRLFSTSVIVVGLVYFALMGAMFFLPQFLQLVQGMTPLESGFAVLPGALGMLVASLFSTRLSDRLGTRRTVMLGLAVVTLGLLAFTQLTANTGYPYVGITFGMIGLGLGTTLPQATNGVLASVPHERAGMGSAVNDAVGELGGSFGVALLGAVMSFTYRDTINMVISQNADAAALLPEQTVEAIRESIAGAVIASGQLPAAAGEPIRAIAGDAYVSGMTWALFAGAVVTLAGIVLAWRRMPARVEQVAE